MGQDPRSLNPTLSPTRSSPMDKVAAKAQARMWTCGCGNWQVGSQDRVAQLPVHGDWVVPEPQVPIVRPTLRARLQGRLGAVKAGVEAQQLPHHLLLFCFVFVWCWGWNLGPPARQEVCHLTLPATRHTPSSYFETGFH